MSYHWDGNNPISEEEMLYNFLDPIASGQEVLDGSYVTELEVPCAEQSVCGVVEIEEAWLLNNDWAVRPNPAQDAIFVDWPGDIRAEELRIYDALGRPVLQVDVRNMDVPQADVRRLKSGLYYVTVETTGGAMATRKVIVE
jgi:hypothetical protein